jgi:predicted nucleotidyltransferase
MDQDSRKNFRSVRTATKTLIRSAHGEELNANTADLRRRVAREAATLLYFRAEKEYKQAKLKAAKTFGVRFLPTNLEVALELDRIAEENEGSTRKERLIQMRTEALKTMKILEAHRPLLIGSVWRGTIRRGSDIDIALHHDSPGEIVNLLKANGFEISKTEWITVTKRGKTETSFHVYTETPAKHRIEIVVRTSEEAGRKRKCEIFGDEIKGLTIRELEKVLGENPRQQFIPV